jgi:hypothetical protein
MFAAPSCAFWGAESEVSRCDLARLAVRPFRRIKMPGDRPPLCLEFAMNSS